MRQTDDADPTRANDKDDDNDCSNATADVSRRVYRVRLLQTSMAHNLAKATPWMEASLDGTQDQSIVEICQPTEDNGKGYSGDRETTTTTT